MSLRVRYAIFFNLFIAIILFSSLLSIYILYKNYRYKDFNLRLTNEAKAIYSELNLISLSDSLYINYIYQLNTNNLSDERVTIVNSGHRITYNQPRDSIFNFLNGDSIYQIVKTKQQHTFNFNDREAIALYSDENDAYVFVSAIDKTGFRKLKNLTYILISVFFGALSISIVITFYFTKQALKPLIKLSNQIEDTTALNLTKQIDEGDGNNEINMIAKNFNAMLRRLNNAFESQKTFVQNASHELRTPLATMLSQTEAALNRNLDTEGYKRVLASLKEDQTNLIELTNSLLLISQYEKINFLNTWPAVRIDELLYETIADAKRLFEKIDITLNFETIPEKDTDLLIYANDTLLKSAFRNLIKNAYFYSDNQKVTIAITIIKPYIKVTFSNSGNQLSDNEIEKITMPFFRGKNASAKKGYGLGLSIVNRIIELHKGTLNYKAINQNENHFIIVLPVA
jgi:signal transduction histidine kinase